MNLFKRGMIFATFFGCCIAMALLVAGLGTKQWTNARAKRLRNPHESDGRINFGLFDGRKELNVAYGWRTYDIDVIHLLKYEPEFMIYGFWIGTVIALAVGIFFAACGAILAAIKTVTSTSRCLTSITSLYICNILSGFCDLSAICFWIAQFYLRIQYNVLSREDRDNDWNSEGMAEMGYSFWLIVGACIASLINLIIIFIANSDKEMGTVIPVLEEKTNGAIMLY